MTTTPPPDLATLRALYPVASGALTAVELWDAGRMANRFYDNCPTHGMTPYEGVLKLYNTRAISLSTPVKRATAW